MPPGYNNPVLAVTPRGNSPLVILALLRLPVGVADSRLQRLSSSALLTAIKSASFPMALLHGFLDRRSLRRKHKYYIKISATHSRLRMKRDLMDLRIEWPRQNHRTKDTKFKNAAKMATFPVNGSVRFLPRAKVSESTERRLA